MKQCDGWLEKKDAREEQGKIIYQVQVNGIEIGYKLIGSGEPLVLIMGLGGTMDHWPREVIEALSKKYQLIILDNRGMGYTKANDEPFTVKLFADDVIGLLTVLGVKKAHALGFSILDKRLATRFTRHYNAKRGVGLI